MARVLLAEDNDMNRDMLRRRLERLTHDVLLAVDGQQAIDITRAEKPDIVLMDLGLPVIDGWTAIKTLKSDPATHSIPIIALTGHVMAADEQRAFTAGCDSFQPKPVDMQALAADIQRLIRAPPSTSASA